MLVLLTEFLMQPAATGTGTAAPPAATGATGAESVLGPMACDGGLISMAPLLMMFAVFYLLVIRPQNKRQRDLETMLKALKKGDIVRTTGGIRGEVTGLTETDVTLMVADRTKINVLRTHVGGVESDEDEK